MNMLRRFLALVLAPLSIAAAEDAAVLPVEDFFRHIAFDEIEVSPDGTKVAALSTWKDHLNLYVIDLKTKKPTQLTGLTTMDVVNVRWIGNNRLLFTGREDGYPTGGLFALDADGKNTRALGKSAEQQQKQGSWVFKSVEFLDTFGESHDEILVTSNERLELAPDVYRMNVRTGIKQMVARNPGEIQAWLADHSGAVRVGFGEKGRKQYLIYRDSATSEWREIKRWDFTEGAIRPLAFDQDNRLLYVASSLDRDTAAICLYDPATGAIVEELHSNPTYDAVDVILARRSHTLLGFVTEAERLEYTWVDPKLKQLQAMIDAELPGMRNSPVSRSDDGTWLVILAASDRDPGTFYLLNTQELAMEKLVSRAEWIDPARMAEMRPIAYQARDGMAMHGYLTLPPGVPAKNLPLIVNPHGGPWVRDSWGFIPEVQFLASRGYAVLQVNFRGSTGYGRKHLEAGYGQWGLAMQDDITDGVQWAIAQGIADPQRVAIYGASYGGYATMAGLAFTPDLYRCGVNYVGVTDIALLLKTIPKSWEAAREVLQAMTGDPKKDRERLEATSPLRNVDKIRVPVFFAYGELDDRVDIKHGTRMVAQLKRNGVPVEWMVRSQEGHGYRRFENQVAFYRTLERFLAANMTAGGATVTRAAPDAAGKNGGS